MKLTDKLSALLNPAALPAVQAALGESNASSFIDNLVNSLAGGGSGTQTGIGTGDPGPLAAFLASAVGPESTHIGLPFAMSHFDAHVDALVA